MQITSHQPFFLLISLQGEYRVLLGIDFLSTAGATLGQSCALTVIPFPMSCHHLVQRGKTHRHWGCALFSCFSPTRNARRAFCLFYLDCQPLKHERTLITNHTTNRYIGVVGAAIAQCLNEEHQQLGKYKSTFSIITVSLQQEAIFYRVRRR